MDKENDIRMKELAELLRQEQPRLMRYACYRLGDTDDAKDALQDTCHKLCDKLTDEKSDEVKNLRSYIFRTLSNVCISRLSQSGQLKTIPLDSRLDNIQYNVMMNRASLTQIPDCQWDDFEQTSEISEIRLRQLQNETAAQAAQRIIQSIIGGNTSNASEALVYYENCLSLLTAQMKGCRATNFKERKDNSYAGIYVFYTLTYPDGKSKKRHIAVRNDNKNKIWIADGGL